MSTDLAVIEAALKAATPGPWEASPDNFVPGPAAILTAWCHEGEDAGLVADWCEIPDAHLIANAPAWLAELLERVKAAEAEVERATWAEGSIRAELDAAEATIARIRELAESVPRTIAFNPSDAAYLSGQVDFAETVLEALNYTDGITPESAASDEVTRFTSANSSGVDETTPRARSEDATEPILRPTDDAPDAVHFLTVNTDDQEPKLELVCTAAAGSPCRKRPADGREEWDLDDLDHPAWG